MGSGKGLARKLRVNTTCEVRLYILSIICINKIPFFVEIKCSLNQKGLMKRIRHWV